MTIYIEVPPATAPPPEPPRSGGESRAHHRSTAQRTGHPEGAAPPSWPVKSITSTNPQPPTHPSDIARNALEKLQAQPDIDPRRKNEDLCIEFVEYLDQCEQKGFMIRGWDTKKGEMINLPMSYNNRWGQIRRRELSDKLERLGFWFDMNQDRPVTMITLTAYHPDTVSVQEAWQKLNVSRGKLLKLIKKYCGSPDYFWVTEPHPEKNAGYAHYHLAVFADVSNNVKDNKGRGMEDKLREIWSKKYQTGSHTYGLDFLPKKDNDKILNLKSYLIKYLRPGFMLDGWSIGTLIFNAHLWSNKFRLYGASKSISKMMNIKDEPDSDIVWLETKLETIEQSADDEKIYVSEILWDRDYIPDWIDNSFWTREINMLDWQWWHIDDSIRQKYRKAGMNHPMDTTTAFAARDKIYHCNWGRPYKGMVYFEQSVPKLKKESPISREEQERRIKKMEIEGQYNADPKPYDPAAARRQRNKDTSW